MSSLFFCSTSGTCLRLHLQFLLKRFTFLDVYREAVLLTDSKYLHAV